MAYNLVLEQDENTEKHVRQASVAEVEVNIALETKFHE
jgi:hypothetical protein